MRQLRLRPVIVVALASLAVGMAWPCIAQERSTKDLSRRQRLDRVRTWMYQIQDVNADGAVDALARSPYDMLVVAQNAPYLLDEDARYAQAIDAAAFEDTWFRGRSDVPWRSRRGGDIPNTNGDEWSTPKLMAQYHKYKRLGIPVFTCDYGLKDTNARKVYANSRQEGFTPLVTRVSLARMTTTPPPDIAP